MTEGVKARAARSLWALFAVVAGTIAVVATVQWTDALLTGRPILYGEGAVAHAAILFREGAAYRDVTGNVAANYPPLYLAAASLGDPFRLGRAVTMLSAVAIALIVVWRARGAGPLASGALALGWLALGPVAIWGAAVKPDLLAVALTLGGVALLERSRAGGRAALVAGALLALAAWAKPTALLPAAAVMLWVLLSARRAFAGVAVGFAIVAALGLAHASAVGLAEVWRHVVVWNALPWSTEQTVLVLVLAAATLGILVVAALRSAGRGIALAYLIGASGVVLLAGREGATINYLLDLAAATSFALATVASQLRTSAGLPVAATVQIAIALWLLTPFGIVPGRDTTTGAWGRPERLEVVRGLGAGEHLVEDSGLLIAAGRQPVIDDLFLWTALSRQRMIDTGPVFERVRRGELASIVSEADLAQLDRAPAYERARWHPGLVAVILERYRLERSTGVLWVYRPK